MDKTTEYLSLFMKSDAVSFLDLPVSERIGITPKIKYLERLGLIKAYWTTEIKQYPIEVHLLPPGIKLIHQLREAK